MLRLRSLALVRVTVLVALTVVAETATTVLWRDYYSTRQEASMSLTARGSKTTRHGSLRVRLDRIACGHAFPVSLKNCPS